MHEKCPNAEFFFLSVFSCTRTEYGDLRSKFPYSVRIQENTDQKKHRIWTLFTQLLSTKLKLQSGSSMNNILATNRVLPQGDRMSVNKLTFYLAQAFREEHQKHSFAKTHFVPHDYCYPRKTSMLNINM